jgi:hypothetical protein
MNRYGHRSSKIERVIFWFSLILAAFLHLSTTNRAVEGEWRSNNPIFEEFKNFISNPPPIEDVYFTYEGAPGKRATAHGGFLSEPSPVIHIRARWQPDSVFVLHLPKVEKIEEHPLRMPFSFPKGIAAVRSRDQFRTFDAVDKSFTFWKGIPTYPLTTENPVLYSYWQTTRPLFLFMNMGANFLEPGVIRWEKNSFLAEGKVSGSPFRLQGELFASPDGRPEKMSLHYVSTFAEGRHLTRFFYGTNSAIPEFLPERFQTVVFRDGREDLVNYVHLMSLSPAAEPMGGENFNPDLWTKYSSLSEFVFIENQLYAVKPDGEWKVVRTAHAQFQPPFVLVHARTYYFIAAGLSTAGFLILSWRMRKLESNQ